MLRSVDLSDYMLHNPVKVLASDHLSIAIDLIIKNKISGLCVVNEDGILMGVLSEMDCLRAILGAVYNENSSMMGLVGDFMTPNVDSCELHAVLVDVASDMLKKGHRRRPVVDKGKLVGQITCRQLLNIVKEF